MKTGFTPIPLDDYVALHLRANPDVERGELIKGLQSVIAAHRAGARCRCGAPIWIIGSAQVGLACFTCITGQAVSDQDYEIEVPEDGTGAWRAWASGSRRQAPGAPGRFASGWR